MFWKKPMTFDRLMKRGVRFTDVRRYLDEGGDPHADSLLHHVIEDESVEGIRLLVSLGVNIDAQDPQGWTPLHWAVDWECNTQTNSVARKAGRNPTELPMVRTLIELGADESIRSNDGETARDVAADYHQTALYDETSRLGSKEE